MEDRDIIREFLIETNDNLARLDNEIVDLEKRPKDADLLASIFRTVHTVKGTCGFLGFTILESITHEAETILSQLRAGERDVSSNLISLILEVMDATRTILGNIESTDGEGDNHYEDLVSRLKKVAHGQDGGADCSITANATAAEENIRAVEVAKTPETPVTAAKLPEIQMTETKSTGVANSSKGQSQETKTGSPSTKAADADVEHNAPLADSSIRVDVVLLDKLMNLVGELVLARNQILQHNNQNENSSLNATSQRLNLITTELQEGVMKTRMQPIGVVWNKLPRLVRDVAHSLGKQVRLELDGASTELDKTIIEAIKDPLTHLVRNSCDHGIERPEARVRAGKPAQGRVLLRAYHEGGQVNIEINDDGAGIDSSRLKQKAIEKGFLRPEQADRLSERESLNLIFHPGFSTAEAITNVSGRGVGMDVVKSNIEKIGGLIDVSTRAGEGTTVRLKIPLTLAIIPGLVVTSGDERFVIPQVSLLELIRLEGDHGRKQIEQIHGTPVYRRRGSLLPIAHLNEVLRLKCEQQSEAVNIVVLQAEDRQFGLVVDGINDTQEIVVKPLGKQLKGLTTYAGATIMGDGRVALILDVVGIGQRSGVLTASGEAARSDSQQKSAGGGEVQRLLLFRAGSFERLAVPLSLVARLEEFRQSNIERAGGRRVIQYRDRILPLVSLTSILDPGMPDSASTQDPAQAIVFNDGDNSVGIIVDQVVDIVEDTIAMRESSSRRGLLGSAVVGSKVADFLDLHAILSAISGEWFQKRNKAIPSTATVLLAEESPFSRGLLRSGLEMAGYEVIEAATAPDVLRALDHRQPQVLLASLELPPDGAFTLLEAVRRRTGGAALPAIGLINENAQETTTAPGRTEFDDYQRKFDWPSMVRSIKRLATSVQNAESPVGASSFK